LLFGLLLLLRQARWLLGSVLAEPVQPAAAQMFAAAAHCTADLGLELPAEAAAAAVGVLLLLLLLLLYLVVMIPVDQAIVLIVTALLQALMQYA
jgi:hypothetical protein